MCREEEPHCGAVLFLLSKGLFIRHFLHNYVNFQLYKRIISLNPEHAYKQLFCKTVHNILNSAPPVISKTFANRLCGPGTLPLFKLVVVSGQRLNLSKLVFVILNAIYESGHRNAINNEVVICFFHLLGFNKVREALY